MQERNVTSDFLSALILAAGSSTRMGRPKQLLPFGNRPLLQVVIDEAVGSCAQEVVLVLGDHADEIREALLLPENDRVRVGVNPDYRLGQSTSLRLGLGMADPRSETAAVLLGDQPGVTAALIDRLADDCRHSGAFIMRPVYRTAAGGQVPGHPVFLARSIWGEIQTLQGDQGARSLIKAHPDWLAEIRVAGPPPRDIDTPEDYRAAVDTPAAVTLRR
jgi:molybdenum cofactor cytidylyltransferase